MAIYPRALPRVYGYLLRAAGARIRSGIVRSPAVLNALVEDPSGNLVELFEPLAGYRERPR